MNYRTPRPTARGRSSKRGGSNGNFRYSVAPARPQAMTGNKSNAVGGFTNNPHGYANSYDFGYPQINYQATEGGHYVRLAAPSARSGFTQHYRGNGSSTRFSYPAASHQAIAVGNDASPYSLGDIRKEMERVPSIQLKNGQSETLAPLNQQRGAFPNVNPNLPQLPTECFKKPATPRQRPSKQSNSKQPNSKPTHSNQQPKKTQSLPGFEAFLKPLDISSIPTSKLDPWLVQQLQKK